jgi:hypothetical protein
MEKLCLVYFLSSQFLLNSNSLKHSASRVKSNKENIGHNAISWAVIVALTNFIPAPQVNAHELSLVSSL